MLYMAYVIILAKQIAVTNKKNVHIFSVQGISIGEF